MSVVGEVGLLGPGGPQVGQHVLEPAGRRLGAVPVDVLAGPLGGDGWSEVGPVPTEHVVPLPSGVRDIAGDDVDDVVFAAAGHRDIGRRGAGVLAENQMTGAGGLALGAVNRGRVRQLDMLPHIPGRDGAHIGGPSTAKGHGPVGVDGGDGPGGPVGHPEVAVVASGRDPVTHPDPFTRGGDHGMAVVDAGRRRRADPG